MVALEQRDDLWRSHCEEIAMNKVKPLDLWKYESFGAKLKAKRMVWEATTPVKGRRGEPRAWSTCQLSMRGTREPLRQVLRASKSVV